MEVSSSNSKVTFPKEISAHPLIRVPTREEAAAALATPEGGRKLSEYLWKREERIAQEKADPYRFGFALDSWQRAERYLDDADDPCRNMLIMGSNWSAKTEFAARRVVQTLVRNPESRAWCFHETDRDTLENQRRVFKYLPNEWKNVKKNRWVNVTFSKKNGFADNIAVFPNGSELLFRNYSQDTGTVEGHQVDVCWCDELVPLDWLETLEYRVGLRDGLLLVTFTPIAGWTPVVNMYRAGAKVMEEVAVRPLVPDFLQEHFAVEETVPLMEQPVNGNSKVVYFHGRENPWGQWDRLMVKLQGKTKKTILERAFGVATKAMTARFPKFKEETHVVGPEFVKRFLKAAIDPTWYLVVDPVDGRNWFMSWFAIDKLGRYLLAREWPQPDDYIPGIGLPGPWAIPSGKKHDGEPGEAQEPFGFGLERYAEEIARVERELFRLYAKGEAEEAEGKGTTNKHEGARISEEGTRISSEDDGGRIEVFERIMDSRYGNAPTTTRTETTTLIDQLAEEPMGLDFIQAPGGQSDRGMGWCDLVNDLLDYDEDRPVVAGMNEPKFYVSDRCGNTIYSLKEWTGRDGLKGACKDPIDCVKYGVLADLQYVGGEVLMARGGGCY